MLIEQKITCSFKMPEEYQLSWEFQQQHSDWAMISQTTQWVAYSITKSYITGLEKGENNETD